MAAATAAAAAAESCPVPKKAVEKSSALKSPPADAPAPNRLAAGEGLMAGKGRGVEEEEGEGADTAAVAAAASPQPKW